MASGPDPEATAALASLYARTIVGSLRPSTLRSRDFPYEPTLAAQFQSELETSTDALLLMNTAMMLGSLVQQGRNAPELAPARELAERLRERGRQYLRPFPTPPNGVRPRCSSACLRTIPPWQDRRGSRAQWSSGSKSVRTAC